MVTDDERRFKCSHLDIPPRSGKIGELNRFDAEFFGIPRRLANVLDPMSRLLLEKTYEAIIDAGTNILNTFLSRHFATDFVAHYSRSLNFLLFYKVITSLLTLCNISIVCLWQMVVVTKRIAVCHFGWIWLKLHFTLIRSFRDCKIFSHNLLTNLRFWGSI